MQKINFTEDLRSDINFHKLKIKFISLRKIVKYLIKNIQIQIIITNI